VQGGVEGAFLKIEDALGLLFNFLGDSVAVVRTRAQVLQNQCRQSAGKAHALNDASKPDACQAKGCAVSTRSAFRKRRDKLQLSVGGTPRTGSHFRMGRRGNRGSGKIEAEGGKLRLTFFGGKGESNAWR
jgi:hypothetical protein